MAEVPIPQLSILDPQCRSRTILEILANKWSILIILVLSRGTQRSGELQQQIGGVTRKMFTQTLRSLEKNGIITRHTFPVVPPKVEYTLTPLGESLIAPIEAFINWTQEHTTEVEQAQKVYSQREYSDSRAAMPVSERV
jgi:DNA-binding HxlR family transcriptional regulator